MMLEPLLKHIQTCDRSYAMISLEAGSLGIGQLTWTYLWYLLQGTSLLPQAMTTSSCLILRSTRHTFFCLKVTLHAL